MATIQQNLEAIRTAIYGRDVRTAIHDSIEQCYDDSMTAANAATTAATEANNGASAATESAREATASASRATEAADGANTAAQVAAQATQEMEARLTGMTASAVTGNGSGVSVTEENGHYHFAFTLEKGDAGTNGGNYFYSGTAITGKSSTPAVYSTGIENALVNDRYFYNGVESANMGNVYRCTKAGGEDEAEWIFDQNIRGTAGSGSVSMVNGESPDENGNVILVGADILLSGNGDEGQTIEDWASEMERGLSDVELALDDHVGDTSAHVSDLERAKWNSKANNADFTAHTGDSDVHVTSAERIKWNSASKIESYRVSVPVSGWEETDSGWSQTVDVTGITEEDEPLVDWYPGASPAVEGLEAYQCVSYISTASDSITLVCLDGCPETDFQIAMKIIRAVS